MLPDILFKNLASETGGKDRSQRNRVSSGDFPLNTKFGTEKDAEVKSSSVGDSKNQSMLNQSMPVVQTD